MIGELTTGGALAIYSAAAGAVLVTLTLLGLAVRFVLVPYMKSQIIEPLHETRHQVTVNHHSSEKPTILDMISDARADVRVVRSDVNEVKAEVLEVKQTQSRDGRELKNHLIESAEERRLRTHEQVALWDAVKEIAKAGSHPDPDTVIDETH